MAPRNLFQEKNNNTQKKKTLHNPGYFSSNHVLVNRERARYGRSPLMRSAQLDAMARQHAVHMAEAGRVGPSVPHVAALQRKLHATWVGETTLRGESIRALHDEMMMRGDSGAGADDANNNNNNVQARNNILASRFDFFGMGTAMGPRDGKLYLVQLFAGGQPLKDADYIDDDDDDETVTEEESHTSSERSTFLGQT